MQQKYNDDYGDIFDAAVPDDSNMYSRDMDEVIPVAQSHYTY